MDMQEKYKTQTKELRDAMNQRKMAMDEFTEINERLADNRAQKTKLSRQLRDMEEEMEEHRQKAETLRAEVRKSDKSKREVTIILGITFLTMSYFFIAWFKVLIIITGCIQNIRPLTSMEMKISELTENWVKWPFTSYDSATIIAGRGSVWGEQGAEVERTVWDIL